MRLYSERKGIWMITSSLTYNAPVTKGINSNKPPSPPKSHPSSLEEAALAALKKFGDIFNSKNPRKDLMVRVKDDVSTSNAIALSFIIGRYQEVFPDQWQQCCEKLALQLESKSNAAEAAKFLQQIIDEDYPDYLDLQEESRETFENNRKHFSPEQGDFGGVALKDTPSWYRDKFPSIFM